MRHRARHWGMALLIIPAAALLGWMVMLLWNAVIPALFVGSRTIDYPHALGLLVLSRILFGGFRGHGGWHRHRRWHRWEAMSPEDREQYAEAVRLGEWIRGDNHR
jgi:hypothetical protein